MDSQKEWFFSSGFAQRPDTLEFHVAIERGWIDSYGNPISCDDDEDEDVYKDW